jgi:hypothetical protein
LHFSQPRHLGFYSARLLIFYFVVRLKYRE